MDLIYLISGIVGVGLVIYLVIALLNPESFL